MEIYRNVANYRLTGSVSFGDRGNDFITIIKQHVDWLKPHYYKTACKPKNYLYF